MNFNFKLLFRISAAFFLIVALFYFVLPKLEFSKPELNRGFGTFFNIFCVLFSVLLFLKIRTIKNKVMTIICAILNFTFFNAIFNVADVAISTGVGILIVFNKRAFAHADKEEVSAE